MLDFRGMDEYMLRMLKKMDGVIIFVMLLLMMILSVFAIYSGTQTDAQLANHHVKTMYFMWPGSLRCL